MVTRRASRLSKPVAAHYAKPGVLPGEKLVEFRLAEGEGEELKTGAELKVDLFKEGQIVDVAGTTIGKGYAGVMKRHGFAGGMASHGASVVHRSPGSIGQRQTPGRVLPGKRMAGRMGNVESHGGEPEGRPGGSRAESAVRQRFRAGGTGRACRDPAVGEVRGSRQAQVRRRSEEVIQGHWQ